MKHLIPLILAHAISELHEHRETPEDKLYLNTFNHSHEYTYQNWGDSQEIDEIKLKELLTKDITESLEKHNKVIIYTCRDNSMISIDNVGQYPEDIEDLDHPSEPELKGILYLAYD